VAFTAHSAIDLLKFLIAQLNLAKTSCEPNLLEPGCRPVRSQIPLRYLVAGRSEADRRPVTDLLAGASSLLASDVSAIR